MTDGADNVRENALGDFGMRSDWCGAEYAG
jgi:hypothetical protein